VECIFVAQFVVFQISFNCKKTKYSVGEFGKLGHGDTKERNIPTQVDFFDGKKIIQIVCGYNHCLD
jgi:alpha-tubulin suppressor-like RCC1 family protein